MELKNSGFYSDPNQPKAEFLVLRLDSDPAAQKAAYEYAIQVAKYDVAKADDILRKLEKYRYSDYHTTNHSYTKFKKKYKGNSAS